MWPAKRVPGTAIVLAAALCAPDPGSAQLAPRRDPELAAKVLRHPDLTVPNHYRPLRELSSRAAAQPGRSLADLEVEPDAAWLDLRTGRWGTLLPSRPLIPGAGRGNGLTWQRVGRPAPKSDGELGAAAWERLLAYLEAHQTSLGVESRELEGRPRISVHEGGELIQIHAARVFEGLPVRDSYLTAVVNHGNLVLLGFRNWGPVQLPATPAISVARAREVVRAHLAPLVFSRFWGRPEMAIVPLAAGPAGRRPIGQGLRHRLVWVLRPEVEAGVGRWEALVDAHGGDLLAFRDIHRYATPRTVSGGVYPATNYGLWSGGTEVAGFPMPHADVTSAGGLLFTDGGGNLPICAGGTIGTALDGSFVQIVDICGNIAESSTGSIDLGTSSGTDCAVPAGASSGNTHASRTAYYHLNRMREMALGQVPGNSWLQSQVPSVVNFPSALLSCNAFWDGLGVNFFTRDSTLPCANTGELAGVVAHELAHGFDDNDANGLVSNPAEGIADVFAALYLNDSCIGRGFFEGASCDPGDGDPCKASCDGAREIDYDERLSGDPHDVAFIDASCPPGLGDAGPCGGAIHCEGAVVSEAAWDLWNRDLPDAGFGAESSREVATRLYYLGSETVGQWFQCTPGSGAGDGCNADGGYLGLLAADDDNGSLADGTPHMTAIAAAFGRHGIACGTPTVRDSGCVGAPAVAPVVTADPLDRAVKLTWAPVTGASGYAVFRGEGELGCVSGKVKVGETASTELIDEGLRNGFPYAYVVIPIGAEATCLGPASGCTAATPVAGANLGFDTSSGTLSPLTGDGDAVLDNCETAEFSFDLHNVGTGELTNARIVEVEVLSGPATVTITTPLPISLATPLAECAIATASFELAAQGLSHNDVVEFRVAVTADELGGAVRSAVFRVEGVESDLVAFASKTFGFETDLEGWHVVQGGFARATGSGAESTSAFVASSGNLPDQCDQIRSPLVRLSPTSTLTVSTWFDIEPAFDELPPFVFWFDRANLALFDPVTGVRLPIDPDGGRAYNASGTDGSCVTEGQNGWADSMMSWAESGWTPAALGNAAVGSRTVQLDLAYGTDAGAEGEGFRFDQVTLTDVDLVVADAYSDVCSAGNGSPDAVDDSVTPATVADVSIAVLANDTDPDPGDTLRVSQATQPANGAVTIDPVGPGLDTVTYEGGCFTGLDVFTYTAMDAFGATDDATVTVDRTDLADHAAADLVLSSQTVQTTDLFRGCTSISAGDGFEVLYPGVVRLEAGDVVVLTNDFTVGANAEVEIVLDPRLVPSP